MFISVINKSVDYWIAKSIIPDSDREIYEYGLELVLFSLLNISSLLITAIFINKLPVSIALIVTVIPLQCFGGGYHATTHLRCFLITYLGWWCLILMIPYITPLGATLIACVAIIFIFILAPVSHKNVNLSYRQRKKMKKFVRFAASGIVILSVTFSWLFSNDNYIGDALAAGMGVVAISMIAARFKMIIIKKAK